MPPARKAEDAARKRRETRAKKILILLVPLLVILVVWQGPKVVDQLRGAREQTESVQDQVVQGFIEVSPSGEPVAEEQTPQQLVGNSLEDTDGAPEPAAGKIISFTRFAARDPFVQLVVEEDEAGTAVAETESPPPATPESTSGGDGASPSSAGSTDSSGGSTIVETPDSGGDTALEATIRVNGAVAVVSVGDEFPESDPAFTLVEITDEVARIGLAVGSFSNGVETLDLRVGDTVTLISQPDGARFVLRLVGLG